MPDTGSIVLRIHGIFCMGRADYKNFLVKMIKGLTEGVVVCDLAEWEESGS